MFLCLFFFKQKTAYEMRISDWSSDVCSSDLNGNHFIQAGQFKQPNSLEELSSTKNNDFISKAMVTNTFAVARRLGVGAGYGDKIGRASCRERVCQYV